MKRVSALILMLILSSGFILRIYGIKWGLPSQEYFFSYNCDEDNYLKGLSLMDPAGLNFNPHYFNWGTFHYYELGTAMGLGAVLKKVVLTRENDFYFFNPQELAKIYLTGRYLSVFFGMATVLLVFLIGRKIYGPGLGLLAGFFFSINPANVIHSHYLKSDASVTFWLALSLLCGICLLQTGRLKWYMFLGGSLALAAASQQNGICFILTILFAHLVREYNNLEGVGALKKILSSRNLYIGYLSLIIVYLIVSPYIYLSPAEFFSGIRSILLRQGGGIDLVRRDKIILDTFRAFSVGMTWPFVFMVVAGLVYGFISKSKEQLFVILWLIPYLAIMVILGALNSRHQMLIYPGLMLLAAGAIRFYYLAAKSKTLKLIIILSVFLSCLYALAYVYDYDKELAKERNIQQEASDWLISNIPAGASIGIVNIPEIRRYPPIIHQDYYYKTGRRYDVVNFNSDATKLIAQKPEYFIIARSGGYYDKKEHDLLYPDNDFMRFITQNYRVIKKFQRLRSFGLLSFKPTFITDWDAPFPVIYVLQKMTKSPK